MLRIFKEVDVHLVIISWDTSLEDSSFEMTIQRHSEKWLYQLKKKMDVVQESKICILVNVDNIHYKFVKFRSARIIDWMNMERNNEASPSGRP